MDLVFSKWTGPSTHPFPGEILTAHAPQRCISVEQQPKLSNQKKMPTKVESTQIALSSFLSPPSLIQVGLLQALTMPGATVMCLTIRLMICPKILRIRSNALLPDSKEQF